MPFVHVCTATVTTLEQTARLRRGVTTLIATTLRKKAELTAVVIEPMTANSSWGIGGELTGIAHRGPYQRDGNRWHEHRDEMATFIGQAHELLLEVLGDGLPVATYVIVTEIVATNWGYGGQTQAHRASMERDSSRLLVTNT